jgi:GNAT superfamily N-acetyltransferase
MEFFISKATENDFKEIFNMICELALFERAPEKVTNSVEQMTLEQQNFSSYIVRNSSGEAMGFALYFFAYYTWVGKSLYLDDIYVKKQYRKLGIGRALLKKVFEEAKQENCSRVRFQVLDWNTDAIEFYRKTGVTLDREWINCDYDKSYIEKGMI